MIPVSSERALNVLWLMADQHNANCLGAAGHPDLRTPNLDRLAKKGTRFIRAYCNNPICGPSRSSFLSGQYVKHHGISGNFIRDVHREAPNLAASFRNAGYATGLIGKAHLPREWIERGFEYVRLSDLADAAPEDPRSCHYFNELVELGMGDFYDQGWLPPGHPGHGLKSFVSELPEEQSLERWTGREAIRFLQERDQSRPFFLKVSFQRPHDPYAPPKNTEQWYPPGRLSLPGNVEDYFSKSFSGKPEFMQEFVSVERGCGYPYRSLDKDDLRLQMSRHFALIEMIDQEVGRIVDELKASGELDNTIIVYVADHGDFAGEHGLMLKNLGIYESIHRIPFILAGPGIPAARIVEDMVESVDLFPTLMDAAGLPMPQGLDGESRMGLARGESCTGGLSETVCEWDFPVSPQKRVHAIRDTHYRLVLYDELPGQGELYDHAEDPGELMNLFGDPAYQEVQTRLTESIRKYRRDVVRVHTPKEDKSARDAEQDTPTRKLHSSGCKWSEIGASIAHEN
jgi:arylsulfatase